MTAILTSYVKIFLLKPLFKVIGSWCRDVSFVWNIPFWLTRTSKFFWRSDLLPWNACALRNYISCIIHVPFTFMFHIHPAIWEHRTSNLWVLSHNLYCSLWSNTQLRPYQWRGSPAAEIECCRYSTIRSQTMEQKHAEENELDKDRSDALWIPDKSDRWDFNQSVSNHMIKQKQKLKTCREVWDTSNQPQTHFQFHKKTFL